MPFRLLGSFFTSSSDEINWLEQLQVDIVRKPRQRSVSVRVRPSGLVRVTCSKSTKVTEIQNFLLANKSWVEQSQKSFSALRERYPQKRFFSGERYIFQGREIHLATGALAKEGRPRFYFKNDFLIFSHDLEKYSPQELKNWLRSAYKSQAKKMLKKWVEQVSLEMDLRPTALSYRSQRTRWGSCSSEGKVSLNWRLIVAPPEVARYVVVHELAHLKHPDHSREFWSLVRAHCLEFKQHKKWLETHQYEMDFLAKNSELHL
jgi:predicted metal-dependent hydrolase